MYRVLVTDAEQRSALAVTRSLGTAGWDVHVGSSTANPLAGASRYASAAHRTPDPRRDPEGFVTALDRIVEECDIDVLLPMTDVSATIAVSMGARHPGLTVPLPRPEVWSEASDKRRLMEIAGEVGVPVPRQFVVEKSADVGECVEWAQSVGFPVVLKPHRSAVQRDGRVMGFDVTLVSSPESLEQGLEGYPHEAFPILMQERVIGPGLGAFFLCNDGEVVAAFAHHRLREKPPTGGVSVLRESVPLRDDLRAHGEALLRHFRWSGVAMVEFKEDASTGTPYLMEINGRFWGSLQLAIDAGVDFPVLLLEEFGPGHEGDRSPGAVSRYRTGVRSRWFWGDVDHLIWFVKAPRRYREAESALPGRLSAFLRFLVPWHPNQRFEVLRVTDPRPFLRESHQWLTAVLFRK